MKKLLFGLLFAGALSLPLVAGGEQLSPVGVWPLCAAGFQMPGCALYQPGAETYMVVGATAGLPAGGTYRVSVLLASGVIVTLTGVRQYQPVTFGGVVVASIITAE